MTVEQAVDRLTAQFPAIVGAVSRIAFAVNREYADGQTILHDGDELALIPQSAAADYGIDAPSDTTHRSWNIPSPIRNSTGSS